MKTLRRHLAYFLVGVIAFVLFVNLLPEASYKAFEIGKDWSYSSLKNEYAWKLHYRDIIQIWPYLFGGCVWLVLALLDPAKRKEVDQD